MARPGKSSQHSFSAKTSRGGPSCKAKLELEPMLHPSPILSFLAAGCYGVVPLTWTAKGKMVV
jgi:hypothetical protein